MAQAAPKPERNQLMLEETFCVALSKVGNEQQTSSNLTPLYIIDWEMKAKGDSLTA